MGETKSIYQKGMDFIKRKKQDAFIGVIKSTGLGTMVTLIVETMNEAINELRQKTGADFRVIISLSKDSANFDISILATEENKNYLLKKVTLTVKDIKTLDIPQEKIDELTGIFENLETIYNNVKQKSK